MKKILLTLLIMAGFYFTAQSQALQNRQVRPERRVHRMELRRIHRIERRHHRRRHRVVSVMSPFNKVDA